MMSPTFTPTTVSTTVTRILGFALIGLLAGCSSGQKSEITTLFNGKNLDGWVAYTEKGEKVPKSESGFTVCDGELCIEEGPAYWLSTKRTYTDFGLRLEVYLDRHANSGIFVRAPQPAWPAQQGFEIQVLPDRGVAPDSKGTAGAIFDVLTPMREMASPPDNWNSVEITCKGSVVIVRWNEFKVIDGDRAELTEPIGQWNMAYADKPKRGFIGLQSHGGIVRYRNIRLREL